MFKGSIVQLILVALTISNAGATTLKVGVPNKIHSLNPLKTSFAQERYILPLIYQPLFELDLDQNIQPGLAESYNQIKPGVLRVKIKKDISFQDGSKLTATDVAKSVVKLCKNGSRGVQAIRSVKGCGQTSDSPQIEIKSETEVDFHINSSVNYFLYEFASSFISVFKEVGDEAIGSGEYSLASIKEGNAILRRLRGDGPDEIKFIYVNDDSLSSALENRQIDVGSMYRESDLEHTKIDAFNLHRTSNYVTQILVVNPAIEKKLGIKTMKRIKDRIRAFEVYKCGPGRTFATGVVPAGIGGHLDEQQNKLENVGAKEHRNVLSLTFYQARDRANDCENNKIKAAFQESGVNVAFKFETEYPALVKHFGEKAADGYIELFTFSRDASRFFERFTPGTSQPFFYIQSQSIRSKLDQAISKMSITDRFSTYREISKDIESLNTVIPLYYQGHLSISNKCVLVHSESNERSLNLNTFLFLKNMDPKECK